MSPTSAPGATSKTFSTAPPRAPDARIENWWSLQAWRSQLAMARLALLSAGVAALLWGVVRMALAGDALSGFLTAAGLALVVLVWVARYRPRVALGVGSIIVMVLMPIASYRLLTAGSRLAAAWAIQSVVPSLAFGVMILVLVAILIGVRAAGKLHREADRATA